MNKTNPLSFLPVLPGATSNFVPRGHVCQQSILKDTVMVVCGKSFTKKAPMQYRCADCQARANSESMTRSKARIRARAKSKSAKS